MSDEQALSEAREHVPDAVHAALTASGFVPTGDAGNLWFYDRGPVRLLFGEDGTDYPQSLDEPVTVGPTNYATLREALAPYLRVAQIAVHLTIEEAESLVKLLRSVRSHGGHQDYEPLLSETIGQIAHLVDA